MKHVLALLVAGSILSGIAAVAATAADRSDAPARAEVVQPR